MGNSDIEIGAASAGGTLRFAVNTISFGRYRRGFSLEDADQNCFNGKLSSRGFGLVIRRRISRCDLILRQISVVD
jgi:hypothetical protein